MIAHSVLNSAGCSISIWTRLQKLLGRRICECEVVAVECELELLACTGREKNFSETLQPLHRRRDSGGPLGQIKLGDFFSCTVSDVFDGDRYGQGLVLGD